MARPVYRRLVERPLWWFLGKVKAFFFAEVFERLSAIENRLAALEQRPNWEARFEHLAATNGAQWDAIEQLLLALFRTPQAWPSPPISRIGVPERRAKSMVNGS